MKATQLRSVLSVLIALAVALWAAGAASTLPDASQSHYHGTIEVDRSGHEPAILTSAEHLFKKAWQSQDAALLPPGVAPSMANHGRDDRFPRSQQWLPRCFQSYQARAPPALV